MNKKKITLFITTFVFTVCIFLLIVLNIEDVGAEIKNNPNNYWSRENTPIFYGASKISIPNGELFDLKDARFRVFARDFEDGELTRNIVVKSNNVDTFQDGTYEVVYSVVDSHGNKTDFTQTVVVETGRNKINLERVVYTLPSADHLHKIGVYRADAQDRQILGIYLSKDAEAKVRSIDADMDMTIQYYSNDSWRQGSTTKIPKSGEWTTIKNEYNKINPETRKAYDPVIKESANSVPLLQTIMLNDSNNSLTKTFKIEVEYDLYDESNRKNTGEVRRLKFYYYQDNFNDFLFDWNVPASDYNKTQQQVGASLTSYDDSVIYDQFAVIDSYRMMIVADSWCYNKLHSYGANWFDSLDHQLEYFNKMITRYDEMFGVSKNPENVYDQNVESKNTVKPNAHGAGAAYYSTNHIGVNFPSDFTIFERNWGGLHETGHGYQGPFGNGSQMNLGETSNNVFAVYVQRDKSIYTAAGSWLGEMVDREIEVNNYRFTTGGWPDNSDLKRRLYILMNIFDNLEGPDTYAKMYSWYRNQVINNGYKRENHDAYVESLADIYHINIIPYMEAWGLNISESVKNDIYSRNLKLYNILGDTLHDTNLSNFMTDNNVELKYALIDNSLYKKTNIKNNLNITINIDDISKAIGKRVLIKDGSTVIKNVEITSSYLVVEDVPVGTYFLQMPSIDGYTKENTYVLIKDNEETQVSILYTPFGDYDFGNYVSLRVKGGYNTYGCIVTFSENYTKATITLGAASIGTNNGAYVKILDDKGNTVAFEEAKYISENRLPKYVESGGQYFDWTKSEYTVDIGDGYVLEIKEPNVNGRLKVFSTYTTSYDPSYAITDYDSTTGPTRGGGDINRYVIKNNTFKREGMSDEVAEEIAYYYLKNHLIEIIDGYQNNTNSSVVNDRSSDFSNKLLIMKAYSLLKSEDKLEYTEFLTRIVQGGMPVITYNGKTTYTKEDNIDLMSLITVTDTEDDVIIPSSRNTTITTDLDLTKNHIYPVKYAVSDSDNNISTLIVNITVNNVEEIVEETTTQKVTSTETTTKSIVTEKTTTKRVIPKEETTKKVVTEETKVNPKTDDTTTEPTTSASIDKENTTTNNNQNKTNKKVSIKKINEGPIIFNILLYTALFVVIFGIIYLALKGFFGY